MDCATHSSAEQVLSRAQKIDNYSRNCNTEKVGEDKNPSQSPVQNSFPEQTSSTAPTVPETPNPKFKLSLLIVGILVFLILIGSASAALIFLTKSNSNPLRQTQAVISPQPTTLQITTSPPPQPNLTIESPTPTPHPREGWQSFSSSTFSITYKYPLGWVNDNVCQNCSAQPIIESSNERYLHPPGAQYPAGITYNTKGKTNSLPLSYFINYLRTNNLSSKTMKELSVGGSVGLEVVGVEESGRKIALAVFENDEYIFEFRSSEEYIDILESLLLTINFKTAN